MRWDVPTRIAFLIGAPLIWIVIAGVDPEELGFTIGLTSRDWILVGFWVVGVVLVSLAFRDRKSTRLNSSHW